MVSKIPQQSIIYLLFCLSGVLIFLFLGIIPSQHRLAGLDAQLAETRLRLEERKTLMPIYDALRQKTRKHADRVLPFPQRSELPREQLALLNNRINETARQAKVEVISLAPSLNALASSSKYLTIEAVLHGDFFAFRKFLTGLGDVPYLEHIEEIQILENSEVMELRVKFSITRR